MPGTHGARAYNESLRAEPPAGSRGSTWSGDQEAKPPEAERFSALKCLKRVAFLVLSGSLQ